MAFKGWRKIKIKNDESFVEAVAPIIISASRSTDIPAFYSDWFFERLKKGYLSWVNPFNRKEQLVAFDQTRCIVFWTKNAQPIIKHLKELDRRNINYYFSYTLNNYSNELEPNVPELRKRLNTFKQLSELLGKERVIWRFDPLIIGNTLTINELFERIFVVGEKIHKYTNKLVFSFIDIANYSRVKRNLEQAGAFTEFTQQLMKEVGLKLNQMNRQWKLSLASCSENVDLSEFDIEHNRCVDDRLMIKLFSKDERLMDFLGYTGLQGNLFEKEDSYNELKDKGQRKECGCIVSKDIGSYNTCLNLCKYCYANHSDKLVQNNYRKHQKDKNKTSII